MKFRGKYEFLSNMFNCGVEWKGEVYRCSETVFQMEKCEREEDKKRFKLLNGFEAKSLGRKVKLRKDWNLVKVDLMRDILERKFCDDLHDKLLEVEEEIVEDNDWGDRFWGRCSGEGKNVLGKLLMEIRDRRLKKLPF